MMYGRALHTLQQATAFTALGCGGSERFKSNLLKKGKGNHYGWVQTSAVKLSIGSTTSCTITEKAPTSAFTFKTFKTLLRHYAKQALTPR